MFDYYKQKTDDLPVEFFDFIVICHCFFWDTDRRATSSQIYSDIFKKHLAKDGYIVLIIQASKLFSLFGEKRKTKETEIEIIQKFVDLFSLKLVWYKRVDSTDQREKMNSSLYEFSKENLYLQTHISQIKKKLFDVRFDCYYILDDYIVLAQI